MGKERLNVDDVFMYGLEASLFAATRPTSSVKRLRCSALTGLLSRMGSNFICMERT